MLERHGPAVLLALGLALVVVGVTTTKTGVEIGLATLGCSVSVLAVVLPRIEGRLAFGPGGLEAEVRRLNRREEEARTTLARVGVPDIRSLASQNQAPPSDADRTLIKEVVEPLVEAVDTFGTASYFDASMLSGGALREAARGFMAVREWEKAAEYLDRYVAVNPSDWDAQFSRAVSYANSRRGDATDLAALRAYNDAIALRPPDIDQNLLARLLSYRAAMFKRLNRLSEAEADLSLAKPLATRQYEREDITYNQACVAALRQRRDEMLDFVRALSGTKYIAVIRSHLDDYFAHFENDPDFLALLATR